MLFKPLSFLKTNLLHRQEYLPISKTYWDRNDRKSSIPKTEFKSLVGESIGIIAIKATMHNTKIWENV